MPDHCGVWKQAHSSKICYSPNRWLGLGASHWPGRTFLRTVLQSEPLPTLVLLPSISPSLGPCLYHNLKAVPFPGSVPNIPLSFLIPSSCLLLEGHALTQLTIKKIFLSFNCNSTYQQKNYPSSWFSGDGRIKYSYIWIKYSCIWRIILRYLKAFFLLITNPCT